MSSLLWGMTGMFLHAQEISFEVEQRNRGEIGRGYKGVFGDQAGVGGVILNRTRLSVEFEHAYVDAKVTLQNSGMWGTSNKESANNSIVVYESYANMKLGHGLAFKAGRQELKYDEGRILSAPKWGNSGCSHDALVLSYTHDNLKIHLGGAYNNDNKNQEYYKTDTYSLASDKWYRSMFYGWANYRFGKRASLSLLYLNEGLLDADMVTHHRSTFGGQADFRLQPLSFSFSVYGQAGHDLSGNKEGGYLLAGKVAYAFSKPWNVKVGYDYYSNARDGHNGFTWLYGSPHNFAGYMDLWLDNLPALGGLNDIYAGLSGTHRHLSYALDYHNFHMTHSMAPGTNNKLGNEIDLTLAYEFKEWISVECGASGILLTDASRAIKQTGLDASGFGYLTLLIHPSALQLALKGKK